MSLHNSGFKACMVKGNFEVDSSGLKDDALENIAAAIDWLTAHSGVIAADISEALGFLSTAAGAVDEFPILDVRPMRGGWDSAPRRNFWGIIVE